MGELETRSGFVALAGRPNVGKSTLANAIVGAKVAIVSDKPQTTRRAIRGVATGPDWQLILIDLPGVQRPRDAMTERMQQRVQRELADADGCVLVVNAQQGVGPGDRFIAELLRSAPVPVTIVVNKTDRAEQGRTAATLQDAADLGLAQEIFPVSARTGSGVATLTEYLVGLLPEGPFYFSAGERSDQTPSVMLAELVREQILSRTREEVPHSVEVEVQEIRYPREDLVLIEAVGAHRHRVPEGDPDRRRGPDDQVDRNGGTTDDRARVGHPGPSRAVGPGPPPLADRRAPARPARDRVAGRLEPARPRERLGIAGRFC